MKKATVKFIKHATKFRLGYHVGETGIFDEKQAKLLVEQGYAVYTETSVELPEDLPGRNHVLKSGLTLDELKEVKDFTEIKGITKNLAEKLTQYFNPQE
jgi:hypothetical protein